MSVLKKKGFLAGVVFLLAFSLSLAASALAAEKLRYAAPTKTSPHHNLPALAAEEKGFWARYGLEGTLTTFGSESAMFRALAAGQVDMGVSTATGTIVAAARGVPALLVADTHLKNYRWLVNVLKDSPIRAPTDLKGTRIGIASFGGTAHAFGRVVARALGIEKEVKFVAAGGARETTAALKAGVIDANVQPLFTVAPLRFRGEIREVADLADYLPRPWAEQIIFARKELAKNKPELVTRALRALREAAAFMEAHPDWTKARMVSFILYPEEVARQMEPLVRFGSPWRIEPKAVENVRNFMLEYQVIAKAPPAPELYLAGLTE